MTPETKKMSPRARDLWVYMLQNGVVVSVARAGAKDVSAMGARVDELLGATNCVRSRDSLLGARGMSISPRGHPHRKPGTTKGRSGRTYD